MNYTILLNPYWQITETISENRVRHRASFTAKKITGEKYTAFGLKYTVRVKNIRSSAQIYGDLPLWSFRSECDLISMSISLNINTTAAEVLHRLPWNAITWTVLNESVISMIPSYRSEIMIFDFYDPKLYKNIYHLISL